MMLENLKQSSRNRLMKFEDRYVAFIDILGFSDLVRRSSADADLLGRLATVLGDISNYKESVYVDERRHLVGAEVSSFSDCIVISAKCTGVGLGVVIGMVITIYHSLLHQGVFTRGAISKGGMIHNKNVCFGQGLISAYGLESGAALYPRIIFDSSVVEDFSNFTPDDEVRNFKKRGEDGLWFVHVFEKNFLKLVGLLDGVENSQQFMALGRKEIEAGLESSSGLSVKAKVTWLANYFNEFAKSCGLPEIYIK